MSEDPTDDDPGEDAPDDRPDGDDAPGSDDLPTFPAERTGWADVPDVPPPRDPADPTTGDATDPDAVDDLPTIRCSICDREWDLAYELDELAAGNRAAEQFALDHERHTGHYPDEMTPWIADCRACPDGERFLAERPARRFAHTHARHTGHSVDLVNPDDDGETIGPDDAPSDGGRADG